MGICVCKDRTARYENDHKREEAKLKTLERELARSSVLPGTKSSIEIVSSRNIEKRKTYIEKRNTYMID